MTAIDELREYGHDCCARVDDAIHDYADAIEAELSERYMLLPLDAEGVPIHVGDVLESGEMGHEEFTVDGIGYHDGTAFNGCGVVFHTAGHCLNGWNRFNAGMCHHFKPRTIEDVLRDFANRAIRVGISGKPIPVSETTFTVDEDVIVEIADEIKGMK